MEEIMQEFENGLNDLILKYKEELNKIDKSKSMYLSQSFRKDQLLKDFTRELNSLTGVVHILADEKGFRNDKFISMLNEKSEDVMSDMLHYFSLNN